MKTLLAFCLSLFCVSAFAGNQVTASITFTNLTTNGMTLTVNGSVRTWTNNVVASSVQIATNADVTGCGSKTNAFNQISLNPFALVQQPNNLGTNSFSLTSVSTNPLVVTIVGNYASISYATQTVSTATPVRIPVTVEALAVQTNIDSGLVLAINGAPNTISIDQNATVANQLLGTNKDSVASGKLTLNNTNNQIFGIISSLSISGNSAKLTNGLYYTPILISPVMTNGVNYGNSFSSPGTNGASSENFGANSRAIDDNTLAVGAFSRALGFQSTAVGAVATANGNTSVALGNGSESDGPFSTALGGSSAATGTNSLAVGTAALASALNASAFGALSTAAFDNSTAIGTGSETTSTNQVMLGAPGISTVVQNNLNVQTNLTAGGNARIFGLQTNAMFTGTNNFPQGADIAFAKLSISSLVNGVNAAVPVGTNVFFQVSGPTGSFSIDGINAGTAQRDGKIVIVKNSTGQTMAIANNSGSEPTAANRILTGTGASVSVTSNPGMVTLIYSASDTSWILVSHN